MSFLDQLAHIAPTRLGDDATPFHTDERNRYHLAPLAVVLPQTVAHISAIVTLCAAQNPPIAVIAQGGNTGLVGGCAVVPDSPSVIVSLKNLHTQLEVDVTNRTATVSAGVTLAQLHAAADAHDLFFPLTLASQDSATIGGNLSSNAGGTQVLRYGNMRDLCLGLEVVLPNGEIWNGLNTLRKNNTGYDLKHLFIGAEGTLGIISRAVLKLYPAPRYRQVALIAARDFAHVVQAFQTILQRFDSQLSAFEYMSSAALDLVCAQFQRPHPFGVGCGEYALLELSSTQPLAFEPLEAVLSALNLNNALIAQSEQDALDFWHLREWLSAAQKKVGKNIKHDISLPIGRLVTFNHAAQAALEQRFAGIQPMVFGHVGDGNLHFNVSMGQAFTSADELMRHEGEINAIVYEQVLAHDGSISAEHGIGLLKRDLMSQIKSPVELNLMRGIKQQLDPLNLMNPHKILP
ncbi:MAG: FAD-binding oxidoreductase [Formosimonas sp.]